MDLFANLATGFGVALTVQNLLYCFGGVLLGTLIGVLPGIGPVPTIAMLLPITYALPPVSALIMLAGIYYGAQYGGSTTAILVNIPGEATAVVTTLDGHQMARQGRAGVALGLHRGPPAEGALVPAHAPTQPGLEGGDSRAQFVAVQRQAGLEATRRLAGEQVEIQGEVSEPGGLRALTVDEGRKK